VIDEVAGVGIAYRPEFRPFERRLEASVDCVELLLEEHLVLGAEGSEALGWNRPKIAHSTSLSPARADFLVDTRAMQLLSLARAHGVALVSEHLSFSAVGEYSFPNFLGSSRTHADVERIARNLRHLHDLAGVPIAVENPVTFFDHAEDELDEPEFLNAVVEAADCALLLDVSNLYINSRNKRFDPYAAIDRLDGDRVAYLHVAGYTDVGGLLVDTHQSDVDRCVWALTRHALRHTATRAVVLERDHRSADELGILSELRLLREIWDQSRRACA
jgi:uncharacterized protein (UPF0276 family)